MCRSPPCPDGCKTMGKTGRARRQRMVRTYVKMYDGRRKQHHVPVGWWCPGCHAFKNELP